MKIRAYTDGACSGNPGPGGWGAIINLEAGCKTISGFDVDTTNNRMELLAVVKCINEVLKNKYDTDCLEVYSDSAYVLNAITKEWLFRWRENDWLTVKGEDVKHKDLWKRLYKLLCISKRDKVKIKFIKVQGHSGDAFNEMVDKLAVAEVQKAKQYLKKVGEYE